MAVQGNAAVLGGAVPELQSLTESDSRICNFLKKNPQLADCVKEFVEKNHCVQVWTGGNGIVFKLLNNSVNKISFYNSKSLYYRLGILKCRTLDKTITSGQTALIDYNLSVSNNFLVLHQLLCLESFTLNEVLTSKSTPEFTIDCLKELLAIILALRHLGLIHSDFKPINIMLSAASEPSIGCKRRNGNGDFKLSNGIDNFKVTCVDADSTRDAINKYKSSETTLPYSWSILPENGNSIYMLLITMISCLCAPEQYGYFFHTGYLHNLYDIMYKIRNHHPTIETLNKIIEKILGYKQDPVVVDMLIALIYTVILNSCETHEKKKSYTAFIADKFPELIAFL